MSDTFDGATFAAHYDGKRLGKQMRAVMELMSDGQWRTLYEIAAIVNAPPQSVSARLRDMRKKRHGNLTVDARRRGDPKAGIWEYRLSAETITPEAWDAHRDKLKDWMLGPD